MGASPVVSSTPLLQKEGYKVVGVIVLDVVEGEQVPMLRGFYLSFVRHRRRGFTIDEEYPLPAPHEIQVGRRRNTMAVCMD